jgi:hypothetical protein
MKSLFALIGILIFYFGFGICKYYHPAAFLPQPVDKYVILFTDLRYDLYAVFMLSIIVSCMIEIKEWERKLYSFIIDVGFGFSLSDVIDREYFDITKFEQNDYWMVGVTLVFSYFTVFTKYNLKRFLHP